MQSTKQIVMGLCGKRDGNCELTFEEAGLNMRVSEWIFGHLKQIMHGN